jgi:hypothetical protein
MNFKVGQSVITLPSKYGNKWATKDKKIVTGPAPDEIVTIRKIDEIGDLYFDGYCNNYEGYDPNEFAPIITNTSTADIANQIFETCNDVKEIKIPSLV